MFSAFVHSRTISSFRQLKGVSWQGGRLGSWKTGCFLKYLWQKKRWRLPWFHSTIARVRLQPNTILLLPHKTGRPLNRELLYVWRDSSCPKCEAGHCWITDAHIITVRSGRGLTRCLTGPQQECVADISGPKITRGITTGEVYQLV